MIPILFESNETTFTSNGLHRLIDTISCTVVEERNGIYECDFEYPVIGQYFSEIKCGRIIGVTHDDSGDIQPFDIVSFSKPIEGIVSFHAVHISYRLKGYIVQDSDINTLPDALTALSSATPSNSFTYTADFTANGYAAAFNGVPRSVRQLLGGVEGSILDTYGGEYEWDKFDVILHQQRGQTVDFAVRYGYNMLSYNDETDYSNAYTTAIPYWLGTDANGLETMVVGNKVDSGLTPYNGMEKCAAMDLSEAFEDEPTAAELETFALNKMTSNNVNNPHQSIDVEFVRLQDFSEYSGYEELLQCKLCDSIKVIFPDYQTSANFKIVRTEYDVLRDTFVSMELGTLSTTLAEALGVNNSSGYVGSPGGGGGSGSKIFYGTCSVAAGTASKAVTCPSFTVEDLVPGAVIYVDFTNSNTVANPKLNVNSLGDIAIMRYGTTAPSTSAASSWNAGSVVCMVYDGTYWNIEGWINTTYSVISQANIESLSGTSSGLVTGQRFTQGVAARVKFTQTQTSGTKIGEIEINGTATDIYIPTSSASVTDVQVNGTTVVTNSVADVPVARSDRYGVIKGYYDTDPGGGVIGITIHNSSEQELTGYAPMSVYVQGSGYQPIMAKFLPDATQSVKGAISAADKTKLDGIASGAEVNVQSNWTEADSSSDAYILNKPTLATVATSGSYNDLTNKPTIPTVNDATLTIKKNGTTVNTFTANASTNVTADISVPTVTSDLFNDSGFVTSADLPKEYDFTTSLTPSIDARGVTAKAYTVTPTDASQLTVENCRKLSAYLISSGGGGTEVKPLIVTDFTVSSSIFRIYVKSIYASTQSTTSTTVSGTLHVVAPFEISNVTAYTPM